MSWSKKWHFRFIILVANALPAQDVPVYRVFVKSSISTYEQLGDDELTYKILPKLNQSEAYLEWSSTVRLRYNGVEVMLKIDSNLLRSMNSEIHHPSASKNKML